MKISDRFTDYGMIGGTFWLLQFLVYLILGGVGEVTKHISILNSLTVSTVSILGVIGLTIVFATGLALDLCAAPIFRLSEALVFSSHIRHHQSWLKPTVEKNELYIQQDYSALVGMPTSSQYFRAFFTIWKKESWQMAFRSHRDQSYVKFSSFMLAYVLLARGSDRIEILSTQMSLWNISRTIAVGLFLTVCIDPYFRFFEPGRPLHAHFLWQVEILNFGLMAAAYFFAVEAHDRFCNTLFALVYVIDKRGTETTIGPNPAL
jgi:hypothetical protein